MSKIYVPPIKCQGIKTKLVPWIQKSLMWDDQGTWVEPFMGSGVVGFNIMPKKAIFGDSNPHLIHFYQAINEGHITSVKARAFLEAEGEKLAHAGAEYYYEVRERFNNEQAPLDFLFLNRSCFNGLIRFNRKGKFNVPFGHKPQRFAPAYITKIVNQIAFVSDCVQAYDWQFIYQDFETTLSSCSALDHIYCDPPYIGRHADYFNSWDEEHEIRLYKSLETTPARFIMSTWHSNEHRSNLYIESLWSKFYILTREHFYHVGAQEANRKPMLEALISNYPPDYDTPNNDTITEKKSYQMQLFEPKTTYSTSSQRLAI